MAFEVLFGCIIYFTLLLKCFQAVHNYFKANLKFLVTDTVDGPDSVSKCIRVRQHSGGSENGRGSRKRKERGGKPFDSRGTDDWPETLGKFLR